MYYEVIVYIFNEVKPVPVSPLIYSRSDSVALCAGTDNRRPQCIVGEKQFVEGLTKVGSSFPCDAMALKRAAGILPKERRGAINCVMSC